MSHGSVGNVDCRKHIESSDLFIKAGVAASTTGPFASTTVFLLKAVLEVGVDPEIRNKQGTTILQAAAALPVFEHSDILVVTVRNSLTLFSSRNSVSMSTSLIMMVSLR